MEKRDAAFRGSYALLMICDPCRAATVFGSDHTQTHIVNGSWLRA